MVSQHSNNTPSNHLCYLHKGNPHGVEPLGFAFDGHQKVISVHDGMDRVVHGGHVNSNGRGMGESVPGVEKHSNVMVPMQEQDFLFVDNEEKGINQFAVF
jgi:hypothetical protein